MFSNFLKSALLPLGAVSLLSGATVMFNSQPASAEIVADGAFNENEYASATTAPYLGYGTVGSAVRDVQEFLEERGFYDGPIDGIYGPQTRAAVAEFQEENDLIADGIVGERTWGSLLDNEEEPLAFDETEPDALEEDDDDLL